jgi:hypothetical protein
MAQIDITRERQGMFQQVLANAEPGDEIVYHVGSHAAGAHKRDALAAAKGGQCLLYQRRDVPTSGTFTYIARKPKAKK